ncbi:hypothetical protein XYCOK13_43800 [Xylanibacillus composti]|uniref:LysM domain-containing protein n=2 Tax=Xylanibacillus composti TaxID=1572762 RepID=A0A8J4M512_9BACL|nr:hypothetical protein XYCOK13_43800 [Xylanibacillus composti]
MLHATGVQWNSYTKMGQTRGSNHASIHIQRQQTRAKRNFIFSGRGASAFRMLLVIGFILFSFMFGTFIQTAFGSEEASRTMDEANFAIQPQTAADAMGLDLAQESNQRHVVVAGDTLWALAQAHAPETMDLRQYVHEIKVLNKMQQSVIYEGQVIWLP